MTKLKTNVNEWANVWKDLSGCANEAQTDPGRQLKEQGIFFFFGLPPSTGLALSHSRSKFKLTCLKSICALPELWLINRATATPTIQFSSSPSPLTLTYSFVNGLSNFVVAFTLSSRRINICAPFAMPSVKT